MKQSDQFVKRVSKVLVLIFFVGLVLFCSSLTMPVYSTKDAPFIIAQELQDEPREDRFREYYTRLGTVETPHKRLSDLGRGLMVFSVGLAGALWIAKMYLLLSGLNRTVCFWLSWIGLCVLRIPFVFWYYSLRQKRGDYPYWGDSIGIPVMTETVGVVLFGVASSVALAILMIRRRFSSTMVPSYPVGIFSWCRLVVLGLWSFLLIVSVLFSVWDGDEGTVILCLGMLPLLFAVAAAKRAGGANRCAVAV